MEDVRVPCESDQIHGKFVTDSLCVAMHDLINGVGVYVSLDRPGYCLFKHT